MRPVAALVAAVALVAVGSVPVTAYAGDALDGFARQGVRPSDTVPGVSAAALSSATPVCVAHTYNAMTPDQRLGQLFMIGVPVAKPTLARQIAATLVGTDHVGSLILSGRSHASVASIGRLTTSFQHLATTAATGGVGLVVSTDQEGGKVQVLQGSGFHTIPSALVQGRMATTTLRSAATVWGKALARAGVNLDLAPVADVPVAGRPNPPIADLDRAYGFTSARVTVKSSAFAAGMTAAGVGTTWKHFPGLGRVPANTDTTRSVHDRVTSTRSSTLVPFRQAVASGAGWVMVSLAIYDRIDPGHRAAYSSTVVTGLLRGQLGFTGVVVSDSLSAASAAVVPAGHRAADVIAAGGDVALAVDSTLLAPMLAGVRARAAASPAFRAQVKASVLRVLVAKKALGLLPACR
ncbi:MAG TPA: glycoside hydrolase family 3 N-terminal domain-containing protein [Actinomycetes bacterium]|nr:glycoside hydrolase family 3 N-terminal domain-containing protein [Actinomycetes bacterium]